MEQYLGPFCQGIKLKIDDIESDRISSLPTSCLQIGVVFELRNYQLKKDLPIGRLISWICVLDPGFTYVKVDTLRIRLKRLEDNKKKLASKKKVQHANKYVSSLSEYSAEFFLPMSKKEGNANSIQDNNGGNTIAKKSLNLEVDEHHKTSSSCSNIDSGTSLPSACVDNSVLSSHKVVDIQKDTCSESEVVSPQNLNNYSPQKQNNYLAYQISSRTKTLKQVNKKIENCAEQLKKLEGKLGHFSIRNVNKRDETARSNRQLLREAKNSCKKMQEKIEKLTQKLQESKMTIVNLQAEKDEMKSHLHRSVEMAECVKNTEKKKLHAQKAASYYKTTSVKLREQLKNENVHDVTVLKQKLLERENEIEDLLLNMEIKDPENRNTPSTKNSDGSFSDNVRLCIIELAGLEVAVEKVSPIIQTVAANIFDCKLSKKDLPNSTTVQSIVDEGHFLAKTFIAHKIQGAENWGINRDGTSRKKKKIVDTSVTLDSGDVISLGFNTVARETAITINDITKRHISELSELHGKTSSESKEQNKNYIVESLGKLAFSMSDRASNEKLANKLLDQWRDSVLKDCDENEKKSVHHFHCMAHVLLGFHKYACDDMKVVELQVAEERGPLGRDALPVFKCWSRKGTVLQRVVRTTSEIFGPAGDHLGLRDRWEAYCSSNGLKSVIGNYRDNRFNAIFQTSAEVYVHMEDFLTVIQTVEQPNLKLKAVQADLKSPSIHSLLQCFGLLFLKVTGPYWNLVTSGEISYMELYPYIIKLKSFLQDCSTDPALMLNMESHWSPVNELEIFDVPGRQLFETKLFCIQESSRDLLFTAIQTVTRAMVRTIDKQLTDFLPGGKYSQVPDKEDMHRTSFAHVTNLGCEHHFGDLDSSQKRRPNASMHHHSSVQLLKRNRKPLIQWLTNLDSNNRSLLLKSARKGGRELRETHMKNEKGVLMEISELMDKETEQPKKRRKTKQTCEIDNEDEIEREKIDLATRLPQFDTFKLHEYVAVAYQDTWYPGCVVHSECNDMATVNFMTPCRKPGIYMWPSREDKQLVSKEFVIQRGLVPECMNNGRQWFFPPFSDIDKLYLKYKSVYF